MNKDLSKMVKIENLVPIILGVALSGLSTLMSFAYDEMEQLNSELVEHRLLLSRLISPDGGIIQSPTSAKAKADVIQTLNKMQQDIKVLETKMSYVEKTKWRARHYKYSNTTQRKFWFEESKYPSEKEKYNLGIMYLSGLSKEGKPMHILAYYWLSLSDDPRAKINLKYLKSIMTSTELKKAYDLIAKHELSNINKNKGKRM